MSPELIGLLIQTASNIIQAILQMKANGSLADADLETAIAATDANTQTIIRAALAGTSGAGLIPPTT